MATHAPDGPGVAPGGPFQRPLRLLMLAAAPLTVALVAAGWLFLRDAMVSPGPLAPAHGMLASDCAACHREPFRRLRPAGAPALAQNRDCLRCHGGPGGTIGHSAKSFTATHHERAASDGRACARCHQEHRGRPLRAAPDDLCRDCHRDLRAVQEGVSVAATVTAFAAAAGAASDTPGLHPEFRIHKERLPDPGVLRFNHQRHLRGSLPGPDGKAVELRCQDCHRPSDVDAAWRFGDRRGHGAPEAAQAGRGAYMGPIAYASHCAGCHRLTVGLGLRGDDAVGREEVPHTTPAALRTYLRGQLIAAAQQTIAAPVSKNAAEQRPRGRRGRTSVRQPPPGDRPEKTADPLSTRPEKTAAPLSTRPEKTPDPLSTRPEKTAAPLSTHPEKTAAPLSTRPEKTADPLSTHPERTADPLSTAPAGERDGVRGRARDIANPSAPAPETAAAPMQGPRDLVAEAERGLYRVAGAGCQLCHALRLDADASPQALPVVVPTALPTRFLPRARFDHARHGAAALGGYAAEGAPDCLACHARALESARTSDLLIPGVAECRRCHGPSSGRAASARGGVAAACTTCHSYHVPPPTALGPTPVSEAPGPSLLPSLVRAGLRETREGLRGATPLWPLSAFFALPAKVWGLPEVQPGTPRFRREVFARYGLFAADFANDGLPLGLLRTNRTRDGEPGMVVTCELCHSSSLFGKIIIGQPNPFVDFERLWNDLDQVGGKTFEKGLYFKTPAGNTVVNGADHLGLLGLVLRNPDLSLNPGALVRVMSNQTADLRPEFDALAYVKTPSWYNYGLRVSGKSGLYADGGQPKNGNFSAYTYMASFYDRDGQDLAAALAAWQRSGHAFLASLEAPRYPFAVNDALVTTGRRVYEAECARCHGRYERGTGGEHLSFPGIVIPAAEVGTDPKRAKFPASFVRRTRDILKEEYVITSGYAAPPLAGVWARAPYLHNGAVPTLAELLDPKTRRDGYVLSADSERPEDFDQERVGWRVTPLPVGEAPHRAFDAARVPGLSNAGHRYGEALAPAERSALIEYLKTL